MLVPSAPPAAAAGARTSGGGTELPVETMTFWWRAGFANVALMVLVAGPAQLVSRLLLLQGGLLPLSCLRICS